MAFDFPASPTSGQVYTDAVTGIVYTFDGLVWVPGSGGVQATSPYVKKAGDAMLGYLSLVGPPTAALHATTKQYTDELVAAESLFQGVWNVASNQPDLTPAVMNPLHSYSWIAQTVDPAVPEIALASLPGIGGNSIAATDTIVWNNVLQLYEQIRGAVSVSQMLIADGPPGTAFHGQQWWDSDAGKCYVYYDDGTSQAWVQTSGGGGATKAEVYFGDTAPDPTFSGELWWDTSTGNMMINQAGTWVQTNVEEAPLDGLDYMRNNAGWVASTATGAGFLPLAGGTLTGNLTVNKITPQVILDKTVDTQDISIVGSLNGIARWGIRLGDRIAESGSNVGSDFQVLRYSDTGTGNTTVRANRATGVWDFASTPTRSGTPMVLKTELDDTVSKLETRLAALEARLAEAKL